MIMIIGFVIIIFLYLFQKSKKIKKYFWLLVIAILSLLFFAKFPVIVAAITAATAIIIKLSNLLINFKIIQNFLAKNFNIKYARPLTKQTSMTSQEAREILNVTENSSKADIKKAYYSLIEKNHPDKGGSKYLAAKINQARDVLLDL